MGNNVVSIRGLHGLQSPLIDIEATIHAEYNIIICLRLKL